MKKLIFGFMFCLCLSAQTVLAADDIFGIDLEENGKTDETTNQSGYNISSFVLNKIGESAARNIINAEKVFCYTVEYAESDYKGYTIDGMAVKGSCGELSAAGRQLLSKSLFDNAVVYSNNFDRCTISPKVIFRYIYGPDYTDVLLSTPCSAVIFFHGQDAITINAAPGKDIIEKISSAYAKLAEKYISPALLGQMVPNGQVVNQTQKEMVRRINSSEKNLKKWGGNTENNQQQESAVPASTPAVKKGWNRLK